MIAAGAPMVPAVLSLVQTLSFSAFRGFPSTALGSARRAPSWSCSYLCLPGFGRFGVEFSRLQQKALAAPYRRDQSPFFTYQMPMPNGPRPMPIPRSGPQP
jgi:hypothetical protein